MLKIEKKSSNELIIACENEKLYIEICTDEYDEPFLECNKIIKVQIIKGESHKWYYDKVGEVLEVIELADYYSAINYSGVILKEDAIKRI